jgi:general stress protein 26
MSGNDGFSNADTGNKPADPYKKANLDTEVPLEQKIKDLAGFMTSNKFSMMTTRDSKTGYLLSRCMALAATENDGIDLLFHTNTESGKTDDLKSDEHINISFLNSTTGDWASVSGTASIVTDRDLVKKHYSPQLKAWFGDLGDGVHDGGPEDPRVGVIRVKMVTAHYAISTKNIVGRVAEVAQGAITGKPASVNKLREISEQEVQSWRSSTH